jgi:hypothetical protein
MPSAQKPKAHERVKGKGKPHLVNGLCQVEGRFNVRVKKPGGQEPVWATGGRWNMCLLEAPDRNSYLIRARQNCPYASE